MCARAFAPPRGDVANELALTVVAAMGLTYGDILLIMLACLAAHSLGSDSVRQNPKAK